MQKIINPYKGDEDYNCFACSPHNPIGLHMEFWENGEELICKWNPQKRFEGYSDMLHGGIQSTLIDEMGAWAVHVKGGTTGVTRKLDIKYRKPVYIEEGEITLKARYEKIRSQLANIYVDLLNNKGEIASEGELMYFLYPEEEAQEKFDYPGIDAFYE